MTRPPSITKRLVSQPARPAIVVPAGPSATAEDVTLPVNPANALPAPISTITQPTAFSGRRMTSSAPTEAKATPRNSKPTSARSLNPSASGTNGTGSTTRSVIAPTAPTSAAASPPMANGRASLRISGATGRCGMERSPAPTVPCRSSTTRRQVGRIAHAARRTRSPCARRRSGRDRSVDRPCAGLGVRTGVNSAAASRVDPATASELPDVTELSNHCRPRFTSRKTMIKRPVISP